MPVELEHPRKCSGRVAVVIDDQTEISPRSVNFAAFVKMFLRICATFPSSVSMVSDGGSCSKDKST